MNRIRFILSAGILTCILFANASIVSASATKMVFWYPGEAGTTEEAQPVLSEFFEYLNSRIAPYSIEGKYFNTVKDGLVYIKKDKPKIGIISYAAWIQQGSKIGLAREWLTTLPLPGGSATENYALVGLKGKVKPGDLILSSEPISNEFVRKYLFLEMPADVMLKSTNQLLFELRNIASGQLSALAILTPTEATTLKKLKSPWAKSLKFIAESKPVPTARVVLFDQGWKGAAKLKSVLLSIGQDQSAHEILYELRLKGFGE